MRLRLFLGQRLRKLEETVDDSVRRNPGGKSNFQILKQRKVGMKKASASSGYFGLLTRKRAKPRPLRARLISTPDSDWPAIFVGAVFKCIY